MKYWIALCIGLMLGPAIGKARDTYGTDHRYRPGPGPSGYQEKFPEPAPDPCAGRR